MKSCNDQAMIVRSDSEYGWLGSVRWSVTFTEAPRNRTRPSPGVPFDTIREPRHPRFVRSVTMRVAAVLIAVMLPASGWVQCAGWQTTADARMACCVREGQCPMHRRSGHQSGSQAKVTQAEADACCAVSERSTSTPSSSSQLAPIPLALVTTPVPPVSPDQTSLRAGWREAVPIATSPVPRHLLLSVFLV